MYSFDGLKCTLITDCTTSFLTTVQIAWQTVQAIGQVNCLQSSHFENIGLSLEKNGSTFQSTQKAVLEKNEYQFPWPQFEELREKTASIAEVVQKTSNQKSDMRKAY